MPGGYVGRILRVDLTENKITAEDLDEQVARKYIGGCGVAAKIVWDETTANTQPLSPENPLIFMTGPLTGTIVPNSGRHMVAALSPLTNIWGESYSGGNFAFELQQAGFDGMVVKGKATSPVYIWVKDGEATIVDASHLWGKDTYEVSDLLKEETHRGASVAAIGQAGENLVRFACVMHEGRVARAAARCGLGAVMGYKNLKAIVVKGTGRPRINNEQGLKASIDKYFPKVTLSQENQKAKTRTMFEILFDVGRVPIKNWLEGSFEGFRDKLLQDVVRGKSLYCRGCTTSSPECYMVGKYRRPVYEAIAPLGSQCLVDDMEAIEKALHLCNRFGIDSISTGGVISFAMEAFEKGLLTKDDTDGIDLNWGNSEAMVEMVTKIGNRQGFGQILGEGVKRVSEHIGGMAQEFAIHVKGLELPAHDPRSFNSIALEYATSNRGACHETGSWILRVVASPDLGFSEAEDSRQKRFEVQGKGRIVAMDQDFMCLIGSLAVCKMLSGSLHVQTGYVVQPSHFLEWLNLTTGWDMDLKEFLKAGERIYNLERMINVRRGISRKDDVLPLRLLTHKLREGGTEGNLPPLGTMLNEYYCYRGWSEQGIPTKERLGELDLLED